MKPFYRSPIAPTCGARAIVKTVATDSKGIDDLAAAIAKYLEFQAGEGKNSERRRLIARWRLTELLRERLLNDLLDRNGAESRLDDLAARIANKTVDPYSAVEELLKGD